MEDLKEGSKRGFDKTINVSLQKESVAKVN